MTDGVFKENAMRYWQLGYNVVPLADNKPVARYGAWYLSRQDEYDIERLEAEFSHCRGIGVINGKHSAAVDVDVKEEDIGTPLFQELLALVPPSPMKRFGSKGIAAMYSKLNFSFAKTDSENLYVKNPQTGGTPLEIMGMGVITLPPSECPRTGGVYRWVDPFQMCAVEDLPVFTEQAWKRLNEFCLDNKIYRMGLRPNSNGVYESTDSRYAKNSNFIWRLLKDPASRALTEKQKIDRMIDWDVETHPNNPWYRDPTEKTLNERGQNPRKMAAYYLRIAERNLARKSGIVVVPDDLWIEPEPPKAVSSSAKGDKESLIPKGGMMEMISEFVTERNGFYNHTMSLAAAIMLPSLLAGHRIVVGTSHPNIYMLCTAPSGFGKAAPAAAIIQALRQSVNGESMIGPEMYSSVQSVALSLVKCRRRIDIIDECKNLFLSNTHSASHLRGVDAELCKVWSASGGMLPAKHAVAAVSTRPAISNPFLVGLFFSTRKAFTRYYSTMLAEEGLGGRCLYLSEDTDISEVEKGLVGFGDQKVQTYPAAFMDRVNYWLTMEINYTDSQGRVVAYDATGGTPNCYRIMMTKEAEARALEIQREYLKKSAAIQNPGDDDYELKAYFIRYMEHLYKLMGCLVVSQYDVDHVLTLSDLEWAHRVAQKSADDLRSLVSEGHLSTDGDMLINRYRAWAKGKVDIGVKFFTQWIRRTLKTVEQREVKNFIALLEAEELGHFEQSDIERRKTKWVFTI